MMKHTNIRNAYELWTYLSNRSGISKNYDMALIDSIKSELSINKTTEISAYLKANDVELDILLSAFFRSLSEYTTMYKELLNLFERAASQNSDDNIIIEYDLVTDKELSFNLDAFKKEYEKTVEITKRVTAIYYHSDILWSIKHSDICDVENNSDDGIEVTRWLGEYDSDEWFKTRLKCPFFNDPKTDEKLLKAWKIFEIHVDNMKSKYKNYDALCFDFANLSKNFMAEVDKVSRAFVVSIFSYYNAYTGGNDFQKTDILESLNKNLDLMDAHYILIEKERIELINELETFLSLPIWKHRHELYSVWTSVPFINTFRAQDVKFNVVEGVLSFSFGGSKIAEINYMGHQLQFRAELKTKCDIVLKGKSRSHSIQPDYSLTKVNYEDPNETLIVLECKQYNKPSYTNFSHALEDYAMGRPNAKVILTNYGNFNESTLEKKINSSLVKRTKSFPNFRPESKHINDFQDVIRAYLNTVLSFDQLEVPISISLKWDALPSDLDLWLYIEMNETTFKCGYNNIGDLSKEPYCEYIGDVTDGYGPECITISKLLPYNYKIIVHRYSNDGFLKNSKALITITSANHCWTYNVSEMIEGDYWYVAEIDGENKSVSNGCVNNHMSG